MVSRVSFADGRMNRIVVRVVALALLPLLSGCMAQRAKTAVIPVSDYIQSTLRYHKEYVLVPGDVVEVVVRRVPTSSRTVTIRPDGFLSLPLLDDVKAAGLTPGQLDSRLEELFAARLIDPEVTVIAVQVRTPKVYVVGNVNKAATAVELRDAPTALQALVHAGGFRTTASLKDVAVIRLTEDGYLRAILVTSGATDQPSVMMALNTTVLLADDLIFVPESDRAQFVRGIDDFLNKPLQGINSVLRSVRDYQLIKDLTNN